MLCCCVSVVLPDALSLWSWSLLDAPGGCFAVAASVMVLRFLSLDSVVHGHLVRFSRLYRILLFSYFLFQFESLITSLVNCFLRYEGSLLVGRLILLLLMKNILMQSLEGGHWNILHVQYMFSIGEGMEMDGKA